MLFLLKKYIILPFKIIGEAQLTDGFVMEGTADRIVFLLILWWSIAEIDAYA